MEGQRPLDLGGRIRGPWHVGLTTIMVLVAVTVALLQVLLVLNAWQLAGDEVEFYQGQGQEVTRLTLMAQGLTYLPFQLGGVDVPAGAIAAALAFALSAHLPDSDTAGAWRRVSWVATCVAALFGMLTVLVHLFVQASLLIATDGSAEVVFGVESSLTSPARILAAALDGLLWTGALLVGLLWRAPAWRSAPQDDGDPVDDLLRSVDVDTPEVAQGAVTLSAAPGSAYARPAAPDPPTGPRLEADGSSDTGYDEFRFRR